MTVRVVIADDQELVRAGFRTILGTDPDIRVVGEAADGVEAVAEVVRTSPDVVLMDVRMPRLDGIGATAAIRSGPTEAKVLVLTTFSFEDYVMGALRAGASGFVFKDAPTAEIVRAVHAVAAGDALLSPAVTRHLIDQAMVADRRQPGPELGELTARERETLLLLAAGLSNSEIAAELHVSAATVKTHVGNVLMKLGLRDRVQAVVYAFEHGLA